MIVSLNWGGIARAPRVTPQRSGQGRRGIVFGLRCPFDLDGENGVTKSSATGNPHTPGPIFAARRAQGHDSLENPRVSNVNRMRQHVGEGPEPSTDSRPLRVIAVRSPRVSALPRLDRAHRASETIALHGPSEIAKTRSARSTDRNERA